jgi:hypothetical protein
MGFSFDLKLEAGNWKLETGNWKLETGRIVSIGVKT